MKGIFNTPKEGYIAELPTISEPKPYDYLDGSDSILYVGALIKYNEYLAGLKSYPISGNWKAKTGDVVEFEYGYQKTDINREWIDCTVPEYNGLVHWGDEHRRIVAIPLPDKQTEEKPKVSRFEYAIMEAADPEAAKLYQPYTKAEELEMRTNHLKEQASKLRVKEDNQQSEEAAEVKYFIEDLRTGKWKSINSGLIDTSKPHNQEEDWTDSPNLAVRYDTRQEAEKDRWVTMPDVAVTEHLFLTPPLPVNEAAKGWVTEKPKFECTFVTATKYTRNNEPIEWNYNVWQIKKLEGENAEGEPAWYWGLLNEDGEEWGDLDDLTVDMYFILPVAGYAFANSTQSPKDTAEREVIAFAEWIINEGWEWSAVHIGKWFNPPGEFITTAELYQQYLKAPGISAGEVK